MTYQTLDNGVLRDCTPDEVADIEARNAAAAVPVVPARVYRRQAIQVLINEGKLAAVQPVIDSLDDGTPAGAARKATAQNDWDNSLEFLRNWPTLIQIAAAIGYDTPAKLDALFITAAGL